MRRHDVGSLFTVGNTEENVVDNKKRLHGLRLPSTTSQRLSSAVVAASRIFAFRWRIPYLSMTVLEAVITIGYMLALFLWDFTNSAYNQNFLVVHWLQPLPIADNILVH
jgi:hypothetical protein